MAKDKIEFTVTIDDLKIDEKYFSFSYTIKNYYKKFVSEYSDSHCYGNDYKEFKKDLESYYAYQLAIESGIDRFFKGKE